LDGVTLGEAGEGDWLWLASASSLPVCAVRFAFDRGIAGTAGRAEEAVGGAASNCIGRPAETSGDVTTGILTTIDWAAP